MTEQPSVTVTVTDPHPPLLNGEVLHTTVEVTVTSPNGHPAHLLNAAAVAADTGLRAVSATHPAHRVAQCGRTIVHRAHDTTGGRCPGLDGTEVEGSPGEKAPGLIGKYVVTRLNDPDGKHAGCRFFVLDPEHDPIARGALELYADVAHAQGYRALADDLRLWIGDLREADRV